VKGRGQKEVSGKQPKGPEGEKNESQGGKSKRTKSSELLLRRRKNAKKRVDKKEQKGESFQN